MSINAANEDEVTALVEYYKTQHYPCLLCGDRHKLLIGVFFPKDPIRFGSPKDKTRIIAYTICETCLKKSNSVDLVENAILRQIASRNN